VIRVHFGGEPVATATEDLLEAAVRAAFRSEEVEEGEISLTLLEDREIQALNRDHLGHDRPTDVLAFALWEGDQPVVGDVYVGLAQARRQAREEGVSLDEELVRLTVHGTLHVLGWDHPADPAERAGSEMYVRQEELVARLSGG
jgi:probable rRNA maturation factor